MLATVPEASDACGAHHAAHPRLATSSELNGAQAAAFAVCSAAAAAAVAAAAAAAAAAHASPAAELVPTKNEIWYQGSETPRSGRRVIR